MLREGISPEKVREVSKDINVEFINERGETESPMAKWAFSFLLGIILYISILVYGMYVMRGVIEEKQSRIIEVLLSSVKPFQLMLGKVTGIGLVSLTQVSIWVGSIVAITTFAAAQAIAFGDFKFPRVPISLVFFFLIFFVLGYFLYATMYAIVGAIVFQRRRRPTSSITHHNVPGSAIHFFIFCPDQTRQFIFHDSFDDSALQPDLDVYAHHCPTTTVVANRAVNFAINGLSAWLNLGRGQNLSRRRIDVWQTSVLTGII